MNVQAVIDYLRDIGQTAMADIVERLRHGEQQQRHAAEANLKAYYALKDKYEPRPETPGCWKNNWTGD